MYVQSPHFPMIFGGVMFGEVVGFIVVFAPAPIDVKLALLHTVLDPIETHVNGFGASLFDSIIGNSFSACIVCLNGSGRLGVA